MPSNELEIKDLYKLAKKRVPKMFFDYVDTGSWSGSHDCDKSSVKSQH